MVIIGKTIEALRKKKALKDQNIYLNEQAKLRAEQEAEKKRQAEEQARLEAEREAELKKEQEERRKKEQAVLDQQLLDEQKRKELERQAGLVRPARETKALTSVNIGGQDFVIPRNVLEQFKQKGLTEEEQLTLTEPEKIARSKEILGQQVGVPELERQIKEPLDLTPQALIQAREVEKQTREKYELRNKLSKKITAPFDFIKKKWLKFGIREVAGSLTSINFLGIGLGTTKENLENLNGIVQDYAEGSSVIVENVRSSGDAQKGLAELQKMVNDITNIERQMQTYSSQNAGSYLTNDGWEYQSNIVETRRELLSKLNEVMNIIITGQPDLQPEVVAYLLEQERKQEEAPLITA